MDPIKPSCKSIFLSGLDGIGRRSILKKSFSDIYPNVTRSIPEVIIELGDDIQELYRKLLSIHTPIEKLNRLGHALISFNEKTKQNKIESVSELINQLVRQRETLFVIDRGGLLTEEGKFRSPFIELVDKLESGFQPGLVFVSSRVPKRRETSAYPLIEFINVQPLNDVEARILFGLLLRQPPKISYNDEDLNLLVVISDGHPGNIHFCVSHLRRFGLNVFLQAPTELNLLKRSRGDEYIKQFDFTDTHCDIISCLITLPSSDSESILEAITSDTKEASKNIIDLVEWNIVVYDGENYSVSRPLMAAIEHDSRFKDRPIAARFLKLFSQKLIETSADDYIDVDYLENGIRAALTESEGLPSYVQALVLPSHRLWYAKRLYDKKKYNDALASVERAILGASNLSRRGIMEAYSYAIRSAARLQNQGAALRHLGNLRQIMEGARERSNYFFLFGFYERIAGKFAEAEAHFREAISTNPNHVNAQRELAHMLYVMRRFSEALPFAEAAHKRVPNNPYILDTLVGCMIEDFLQSKRAGSASPSSLQLIRNKIDLLERISAKTDTFADIRKGELEICLDNIDNAHIAAKAAITTNPAHGASALLLAKTSLSLGIASDLYRAVAALDRIGDTVDVGEGRMYARPAIEYKCWALLLDGKQNEAIRLINASPYHESYEKENFSRELKVN